MRSSWCGVPATGVRYPSLPACEQTPVFFGSAISNGRCRGTAGRAFASTAPPPRHGPPSNARSIRVRQIHRLCVLRSRRTLTRRTATAWPALRVCSGSYRKGMKMKTRAHRQERADLQRDHLPGRQAPCRRGGLAGRYHRPAQPRHHQIGDTFSEGEDLHSPVSHVLRARAVPTRGASKTR